MRFRAGLYEVSSRSSYSCSSYFSPVPPTHDAYSCLLLVTYDAVLRIIIIGNIYHNILNGVPTYLKVQLR